MNIKVEARFKPITVTIESEQEAELLHKILGSVVDDTDDRDVSTDLFYALGKQIDPSKSRYRTEGAVKVSDI